MRVKVATAPEFYPISLSELKQQLRLEVSDTDQDAVLTSYLAAATEEAESISRHYLMKQVLEVYLDDWALNMILYGITPIQSIDSVQYLDTAGEWQTLNSSAYSKDLVSIAPRVKLIGSLPTLQDDTLNRVKIVCTVGFSNESTEEAQQAAVPNRFKQAIKLMASRYYLTREDKSLNQQMVKASEGILRSLASSL